MKMKLKSAIALILALAMAFALTACGSTDKSSDDKGNSKGEATSEYVYSSTFAPLKTELSGSLWIQAYTADGAYATSYEKIGRAIPEGVDTEGMTEDELNQYDLYGTSIYFIDNNNNVNKLANYKPVASKENTENYKEFNSGSSLSSIAIDKDGNLVAIESAYSSWSEAPEGKTQADSDYYDYYKYEQTFYLRKLDSTGAELSSVPLELDKDQYVYSTILFDDAGNVLTASDTLLLAFDAEGKQVYTIESPNYIQSLLTMSDGKNYATVWGDSGCELAEIDSTAKALGAAVTLPGNAYNPIVGGGDYDVYFTDGMYFCGYDIETETTEKLLNWVNCDVNSDSLGTVRVLDDGTITGIISDYDSATETYSSERMTVTKVLSSSLPAKETLTMSCMWLDYNVRNMVIRFNRSSDSVRIEIMDYSEFNTEDDYEAGTKKLLTEVMAGSGADIISLNGLPYRQIAAKGLLMDLYPLIDADKEFKRDDFFENVFSALEVDGKLYSSCPSFSVNTVIGATSVVGEGTSWTYDDLDAALANMPEGCEPFDQYTTRGDILQSCLSLDMESYVDWETRQCNFNSEGFIKLLEFANRFPESYEGSDEYVQEDSTENRIKSGRQMLLRTNIWGVDDLYYNTAYFNGDISYIGYPTISGSGNMLNVESGYAISSNCTNKDAAWEFLRTFFTEKYQKSNVWSIPSNINVYNEKLKEAMKVEYVRDEKGEYVLDDNGDKVKQPRYTMGKEDGTTVNVYAMTQEQADQLWEVLTSTTKMYDFNESIINIVNEQAAAYFAGQKSAEEVAKLVQSKANIYVSEQS